MSNSRSSCIANPLVLDAETAADLMTVNPVTIREDASLLEAVILMTDKEVSAVPVLNGAGRPGGVLSRTDVVRYFRANAWSRSPASGNPPVREIMTPALLSVPPETTAVELVAKLLGLGNVHRLFVVDGEGALVGVVSAKDVLRRLRLWKAPEAYIGTEGGGRTGSSWQLDS
jgi:CBS domain-containing protein